MAEPIISAPSVKDLERAIEIEAAKSNPDFNVIKELVDASKTILEQSGGPLRPPTKQETISKYVSQEPVSKQLLRGIQTAPERAFQGLFSGSDAMQPVATPTGRYSAPTLPPAPAPTKEEIEQWKEKVPIPKFIHRVQEAGLLNQEECDAIQQQAVDEIFAAVNTSVKAESAEPSGLLDAVFKAVN